MTSSNLKVPSDSNTHRVWCTWNYLGECKDLVWVHKICLEATVFSHPWYCPYLAVSVMSLSCGIGVETWLRISRKGTGEDHTIIIITIITFDEGERFLCDSRFGPLGAILDWLAVTSCFERMCSVFLARELALILWHWFSQTLASLCLLQVYSESSIRICRCYANDVFYTHYLFLLILARSA